MALLRSPLLFSCQRVYSYLFPYYRHMPRSKGVNSPWILQQCRRLQKLSRFVISHFSFCFLLTCTQLLCCCWGFACYAACSRQLQGVNSHKMYILSCWLMMFDCQLQDNFRTVYSVCQSRNIYTALLFFHVIIETLISEGLLSGWGCL
jgi:hypothetical protein